ncbi:TPA: RNA-binding protein [Streptococcus suis]|nr:RNA-binding protein [Streptococcus suis]
MKRYSVLLQHFRIEERDFVEKMIDLCEQVETSYSYRLTAFLHPGQEQIARQITNYFQLQFFSSQEIVQSEFTRVIIAPEYYELDIRDFQIIALEVSYPTKFHTLTHAQILGSLLNQVGIRREYLGDIIFQDEKIIFFIDEKLGDISKTSVSKISKVPVSLQERDWTKLSPSLPTETIPMDVLVSSCRLDKIVAVTFKLSRANATKLISAGQVKVDYSTIKDTSKLLEIGQLVSVRKYGRIRLSEFLGFSKQGKLKLRLDIIKT